MAVKSKTPLKWRQATPLNTAVLFVPQQEAWIVERMGKWVEINMFMFEMALFLFVEYV